MKLLVENSSSFQNCIDQSWGPEKSVVCRYRHAVRFCDPAEQDRTLKQALLDTSIHEGARVVPLLNYKGVEVHILDETSGMATGTLKSIDGCLTTAFCRQEGARRVVFESGGNTGSALTRYGRKADLETFFFCPLDNLDLLDSALFASPNAHLIGVEDRGLVKDFARLFAETTGIRHIPEKSWRYAAAMFRGFFILEQLLSLRKYDWLAQAVSAGFGPIGIFNVLQEFQQELPGLPRFLGVQQEANCPMFQAWKPGVAKQRGKSEQKKENLLTRMMYDDNPQTYKTYEDLQQLLLLTRGDLLTINQEEFDSCVYSSKKYGQILEMLLSQGIAISLRSGQVLEKTGMIALAGTLKAIDAGLIRAGSSALCCLTSGVSDADGRVQPEYTVRTAQDVLHYAEMNAGK